MHVLLWIVLTGCRPFYRHICIYGGIMDESAELRQRKLAGTQTVTSFIFACPDKTEKRTSFDATGRALEDEQELTQDS